jgi:hypothetical protein
MLFTNDKGKERSGSFSHFTEQISEHENSISTWYFEKKCFLCYYEKAFTESKTIANIEHIKNYLTSSIKFCIVGVLAIYVE